MLPNPRRLPRQRLIRMLTIAGERTALIKCAFNSSDADPTVLCSTNRQPSERPSSTEIQLYLLHNWLLWREMHCMLNLTYTSSLSSISRTQLSLRVLRASTLRNNNCTDNSKRLQLEPQGSGLLWMKCLITDSTDIAVAAYLEAEALRTLDRGFTGQ